MFSGSSETPAVPAVVTVTGETIIIVGLLLALLGRLFWRQIAAATGFLLLAVVFIGVLTLVAQGMSAMNGG
jgi:hypothetical protein